MTLIVAIQCKDGAVLALPLMREPCLFQFDQQGAPEEAEDDLPFVSIASGQAIAEPFFTFIRRVRRIILCFCRY